MDRVFQEYRMYESPETGEWEMDYKTFLDFVLASRNKHTRWGRPRPPAPPSSSPPAAQTRATTTGLCHCVKHFYLSSTTWIRAQGGHGVFLEIAGHPASGEPTHPAKNRTVSFTASALCCDFFYCTFSSLVHHVIKTPLQPRGTSPFLHSTTFSGP